MTAKGGGWYISRDDLHRLYTEERLTCKQIGTQFGVCAEVIRRKLKTYGIPVIHRPRANIFRDDYFNVWTPSMAYVLGFITCDGCILTPKKTPPFLNISVKTEDISVLEFIRDEICPQIKIRTRDRFDPRTGNVSHEANVRFASEEMLCRLAELGIHPRKTGNEVLPVIPDMCKPDYARGVIDGDGSIGTTLIKAYRKTFMSPRLHITSASLSFLGQIQNELFFGTGGIIDCPRYYRWTNSRRKEIISILRWVYNGGFCLQRKYEKYLKILEYDEMMSSSKTLLSACFPELDIENGDQEDGCS